MPGVSLVQQMLFGTSHVLGPGDTSESRTRQGPQPQRAWWGNMWELKCHIIIR